MPVVELWITASPESFCWSADRSIDTVETPGLECCTVARWESMKIHEEASWGIAGEPVL